MRILRKRRGKLPRVSTDDERVQQLLTLHAIDIVIDVGANEGQFAKRLRGAGYTGRIVSFEPGSEAYRALSASAAGDPAWTVAPRMALGAADGMATLQVNRRSDMSSLIPMRDVTREAFPKAVMVAEEKVEVHRLDHIFSATVGARRDDRVFLKLDTQGFEAEIISGARDVLSCIHGLQIEMSLLPLYEGEAEYLTLLNQVHDMGFDLHLVIPGFFSRRLGRQLQIDGVFFRSGD